MEHSATWISFIPGLNQIPEHMVTSLVVLILLALAGLAVKRAIEGSPDPLVPDSRLSFRNIFEIIIEGALGILKGILGERATHYLPLVGTLFIFILTCNLLGIIPGFLPPTSNINTNAAMALIVFILYNYYGFREHGVGYLKQFAGPIVWLAPLMFVIELFSHAFRPFSLSVRLFGNIFGDHMVLSIFADLVPALVPVAFLILGMAVAFIQAFIFAILSAVYIALAVSHEH
ncbi:MAG: F0F1 ATP synthase subunit A [Deltaproteobacteria bacterium]|nr:F0F1 ATP synthase subunit A [Deltaproteobacteria bacterium]